MTRDLPKTFEPAEIEARWAAHWEAQGLFRPHRPDATPFTIVNPPPNVTGALHIGHALDNSLQDVIIRYERLRGKDALWVVGTDHAGIATQMVVERQLAERQDKRTNYSREDFVQKIWEWKAQSGGQITGQLRRLGCSMDWSREQFTMDPHFSRAVTHVFVELHRRGLIYRDKRLVNWDPKLKTAISDLEVETQEVKGHFWHFAYPLADGVTLGDGRDHIVVATTRPETMLADMAVAVHPDDARYSSVIGKYIVQPITGRRIPIIADEHADPALGSGAVKITPGHDFNDFEVGKRAGIAPADMLNMFDGDANVCQTADGLIPPEYLGLHRFARDGAPGAREKIVAAMRDIGRLLPHIDKDGNEQDAEPRTIQTPFGDRGGVVIEPWLTDQWYVDAAKLAAAPMAAVRDGRVEIVPKTWEKTFFNWMENIQPWCVSRQLWWGHQIPAWYDQNGKVYVAEDGDAAQAAAGENVPLTRDPDVLDTWFSSALWPFATLGWPADDAPLLARHYPNDLLISGFDILFFWDARMLMQGMEFLGDVPWRRLYLHGLVRAPDGQKMSKSKGNVVDPIGLIDQYGADALRFFMSAMESQGRDIKMDDDRLAGYRNFATKLWNAARFLASNDIGASATLAAPDASHAVNRWIIGEVAACAQRMEAAFDALRFDDAANAIHQFAWGSFCDWYLELIKPLLGSDDADVAAEVRRVAAWAFDQILVMLHPFMPFITEELWSANARTYNIIIAKWPEPRAQDSKEAAADIGFLIALVQALRGAKAELGIAPGARLPLYADGADAALRARLDRLAAMLDRVGRVEAVHFDPAPEGAQMALVVEGHDFAVPLLGLIDVAAERTRLEKALAAAVKDRDALAGRLANPAFAERAKPEAVAKARADHDARAEEAERLASALTRLG
ncbi:MAG: valine--tRNA ligase [Sphingomonadaceae bacterium]|nr:valine--tRNA ligase [Sphingomonadaceae bacterium]